MSAWLSPSLPVLGPRQESLSAGVTLAASGELIAASASNRIAVYGVFVSALLDTNVRFQSNGVDVSGTFPVAARGGFVIPVARRPWIQGALSQNLSLVMSVATTVGVQLVYDLSPT